MGNSFKKGDQVRFLNDEGGGVITELMLERGEVMVEDESGFSFPHPLEELVLVDTKIREAQKYSSSQEGVEERLDRNSNQRTLNRINRDFKMLYKNELASSERKRGELMEVDLHIHHLHPAHQGMSNTEIIVIQLEHFERMMRVAMKDKLRKVVFIHGVGQGVLKSEIRRMIKDYYPHCQARDASWQQYGQGATMVEW
jgi:hypothetical protein